MPRSARTPPKQQRAIATRQTLLLGAAAVFSRMPYGEARLKDIAEESGISDGALYFHFGNKREIAAAVVEAQQEQMVGVLTRVLAESGHGLHKLLRANEELAVLISSDVVVQGGIRLGNQPSAELADVTREPYFEWIRLARTLTQQGIEDGSVHADVDPESAAAYLNSLFIGVQVLSGLEDSWASMPARIKSLEPYILRVLSSADRGT